MNSELRAKVSIPAWGLCALTAFAGVGWMIASYLFGKGPAGAFRAVASELGFKVCSALFVGASAGIVINAYLKRITGVDPVAKLRGAGIKNIHTSRASAASEFLKLVQDERINRIDITGISLRDFLTGGGGSHEVWKAIRQRLTDEETANLDEKARLRVRLLLLDPNSSEGRFRARIEAGKIGAVGIPFDVPAGLAEVDNVQKRVFGGRSQSFLQARIYEHCPFAFTFITETEVFVEQYYYRDHTRGVAVPLIEYSNRAPQYNEFAHSFEAIWQHARIGEVQKHHSGTAAAIERARIKNIYRKHERYDCGRRIIECIVSVRPGDIVSILAITGRFYLSGPTLLPLQEIAPENNGAMVRFALINPVCQQAILRAVADSTPADELQEALCNWTWQDHQSSGLYQDTHRSILTINQCKRNGYSFELRLFYGATACALLLTPSAAFNEQYFYGRSEEFQRGLVLGGEFPIFEFGVPEPQAEDEAEEDETELEILTSTFDVIWNAYSIKVEDYFSRNEQEDFETNLAALLASCGTVSGTMPAGQDDE